MCGEMYWDYGGINCELERVMYSGCVLYFVGIVVVVIVEGIDKDVECFFCIVV